MSLVVSKHVEQVEFTSSKTSHTVTAPTGKRILWALARTWEPGTYNIGKELLGWSQLEWDHINGGFTFVKYEGAPGEGLHIVVIFYDV